MVEDALVLGAGGSSRAVVFGLIERGISCVHLQTGPWSGRACLRTNSAPTSIPSHGRPSAVCCRAPGCWSTHIARHARPARTGTRRRLASVTCGCRRSGICAAGNAVAVGGAGARLKTADGLGMLLHQRCAGLNSGSERARRSRSSFALWWRPISQSFEAEYR